jgi:zinc transporter 9
MGMVLVKVNHRFLLGQGVDKEIREGIEKIILSRPSIDNVYSIQSQWTGPDTFSFKAEVDFDGTYLAAQLMPRYQGEFKKAYDELDQELEVLLCWYAEDVMRSVEREVRHIEAKIRQKYPGAEYIELEPMSKDADRFAIDDSFEEKLLMIEKQEMQSLIRALKQKTILREQAEVVATRDENERPLDEKPKQQ